MADLSSHYTDRHPDVRKLKQQIAETESTRDRILADLKAKESAPADPNAATANADVPEMRDPSSPMMQLQGQLQSSRVEIANRERAVAELKAKVGDYQARLNQEPMREQQLSDLTRGYEQSKANYDGLLKKKNESAMATSMELLQQGERFRIIDPPSLPVKPEFPNRMKFCGIGLGIGLALGAVVVGAFEVMDDRTLRREGTARTAADCSDLGDTCHRGRRQTSDVSAGDCGLDGRRRLSYLVRFWSGPQSVTCAVSRSAMYKSFYSLKRNPFDITPDPSFLFPTNRHNEALAALYYGVRRHKGFVVLTGEVGTGKTVLLHYVLQLFKQSKDVAYAYIFNGRLSPVEFLQYFASDLGLPATQQEQR